MVTIDLLDLGVVECGFRLGTKVSGVRCHCLCLFPIPREVMPGGCKYYHFSLLSLDGRD